MALWHITLTLGGDEIGPADVLDALRRLADEQPFLLSGRYASDRAELRYWEEAVECQDAAALALRLWGEHRASAGLPPWRVLGLEVVDESVHRDRGGAVNMVAVGAWRPF
ncbi:MAG: hypothetical protein ACJ735_07000 [Actinomycetes bacterium]